MEYVKCYVFQPDGSRPTKRQRTESRGLQASWEFRQKIYQQTWKSLQECIDAKLEELNATTINNITNYLDEVADKPPAGKIPAGLILTGPSAGLHSSLARRASNGDTKSTHRRVFVSLSSRSGSNLKGILKAINQQATSQTYDDDEDGGGNLATSRRGTKLLNYDLQILHDYVQEHRSRQVVIAFEDTEAFDGGLLSEVVELLRSWLNRFQVVCLFSIATSVEFLQQRLSNAALKCLEGKLFDAAKSKEEVEQVFDAVADPENALWIGSGLMSMMLDRQSDYLQSIDSLVRGVQYAYLSAFYANALSLFLDPDIDFEDVPEDHFEALRNTDSFKQFIETLVAEGDTEHAKNLLTSNESLFSQTLKSISLGQDALQEILSALDLIRLLQSLLPGTQISPKPTLYLQALSSKLHNSPLLRTLLLSIRRSPSNISLRILLSLSNLILPPTLSQATLTSLSSLRTLISSRPDHPSKPFLSEHDPAATTLRTTIVAQKVSLSKSRSALSEQDAEYSSLLRDFSSALETHFSSVLVDPKSLPFNEVFLYDLKSPYREVFTPRPRHALERALGGPWDYLDCECCKSGRAEGEARGEGEGEGELSGTQPATAVLYRLYLEGGQLINGRDLWEAFRAVMRGGAEGEEPEKEEETMALFQRGLAEMKYLGLVKGTRKRVDHFGKGGWRGL